MKPRGKVKRDPDAAANASLLAEAPRIAAAAIARGWMFPTPPDLIRARVKAMGPKPKSRRPRADKDKALAMIAEGRSIIEAAAAVGVHEETVRAWTTGRHMRTTHGRTA